MILFSSRLFKHSISLILLLPSDMRLANWRLLRVVIVGVFGVELLDALSSPPEWVNRSGSSLGVAEEDVSSSSITLVDEGGMALIKGRVYVLTGEYQVGDLCVD